MSLEVGDLSPPLGLSMGSFLCFLYSLRASRAPPLSCGQAFNLCLFVAWFLPQCGIDSSLDSGCRRPVLQTGVGRWLSASGAWVFLDGEQSRVLSPRALLFMNSLPIRSVDTSMYEVPSVMLCLGVWLGYAE